LEKAGDERDAPDPNDCFLPITSVGFGSYAVVRLREFCGHSLCAVRHGGADHCNGVRGLR